MLATYKGYSNSKDVTDKVNELLSKSSSFIVSNKHFGDIEHGTVKWLEIEGIKYYEGTVYSLESTNDRLGVFYSNNDIDPSILEAVLKQLEIAPVDIITCCKIPLENNNFINLKSRIQENSHLAIAMQILQCLLYAREIKSYKYVSFLEHDVLYHTSHFSYTDFKDVICNMNYEGKNTNGWQKRLYNHQPLHQLTMNFELAISYFTELVVDYLADKQPLLEPNKFNIENVYDSNMSIHINHDRHFTSHYSIYSKEVEPNNKDWNNDLSQRSTR